MTIKSLITTSIIEQILAPNMGFVSKISILFFLLWPFSVSHYMSQAEVSSVPMCSLVR